MNLLKFLTIKPDGGQKAITASINTIKSPESIIVNTPTVTIDISKIDYCRVNLRANTTISITGGTKDGEQLVLALVQDSATPSIVTWGNLRLGTDISFFPTLSTQQHKLDRVVVMYDSVANTYDFVSYSRGF